jgi:hypothetical protein
MLTVRPGAELLPPHGHDLAPARWAAPVLALAGTSAGALAADACSGALALPATGFALTVAGAVVWIAGVPRAQRNRITLAVAVALTLLTLAALQQLLTCMLGRAGVVTAEMLETGGLVVLTVALLAEVAVWWRSRATSVARR